MTFEADVYRWVTKPHTCDDCGQVKVRVTVPGKDRPGHVRSFYTIFRCPTDCRKAVAA